MNPVALEVAGITNPRDANQAKFSLYYCAARALMGNVSLGSFGIQEIENEEAQQLVKCIQIGTASIPLRF